MKLNFNLLFYLLIFGLFTGCSGNKEESNETSMEGEDTTMEEPTPELSLVWETDTIFTTVESVLYDPDSNRLFTSNIEGTPTEKDSHGSISILNTDGTIVEKDWVTGLNAPKGMAIMGGDLYVTDIDRLVQIDLATGKVTNEYPVANAGFLNDAATDGANIYFSDMNTGTIHQLKDGDVSVYADGAESINGLAVNDRGEIFGLDAKGFSKIGKDSTEIMNNVVTGGDGLVIIYDSTYLASRWQGEIYLIRNGKEELLLDTKDSLNTADIGYIPDEKIVLVPTFLGNKVAAYKLSY